MAFHRVWPSMLEPILRWVARVLTVALLGIVLLIFVGEGFNPFRLTAREAMQMTFFLTSCLGLLAAWRWQIWGGAVSVGAMLLFLTAEFALTEQVPRLRFFYLMLLPGILYIASGLIMRSGKSRA